MAINYKKQLYANNASTTLLTSIQPTDTVISVVDAGRFPVISVGGFFMITLDNGVNIEVVEVRGRVGNTFTACVRGREGTTAQVFMASTRVENRLTAQTLESFARGVDKLAPIQLLTELAAPELVNNNSYIIAEVDDTGAPIVAVAGVGKWRFLNYPTKVGDHMADLTAVIDSVAYTGASLVDQYSSSGMLIQFTTGQNRGQCRRVQAVSATRIFWQEALPYVPSSGDRYEVYQSSSSMYTHVLSQVTGLPTLIDLGPDYSTGNSFYSFDGSTGQSQSTSSPSADGGYY